MPTRLGSKHVLFLASDKPQKSAALAAETQSMLRIVVLDAVWRKPVSRREYPVLRELTAKPCVLRSIMLR